MCEVQLRHTKQIILQEMSEGTLLEGTSMFVDACVCVCVCV